MLYCIILCFLTEYYMHIYIYIYRVALICLLLVCFLFISSFWVLLVDLLPETPKPRASASFAKATSEEDAPGFRSVGCLGQGIFHLKPRVVVFCFLEVLVSIFVFFFFWGGVGCLDIGEIRYQSTSSWSLSCVVFLMFLSRGERRSGSCEFSALDASNVAASNW